MIYFGLYVWALLLPFDSLCADLNDRPMAWLVPAIDMVLLVVIVIAFRRSVAVE